MKSEAHEVHSYCVLVFSEKNRIKGRRKLRLHRWMGLKKMDIRREEWVHVAKRKCHVCAFDVELCRVELL